MVSFAAGGDSMYTSVPESESCLEQQRLIWFASWFQLKGWYTVASKRVNVCLKHEWSYRNHPSTWGKKSNLQSYAPFCFQINSRFLGEQLLTKGPERPQLQLLRILAASRQPAEGKVRFLDQLGEREGLIAVQVDTPKTTSESVENWENWANPKKDISSKHHVSRAKS